MRRGTLFEEYCFHCEKTLIRTVCVISKKDNSCKKNDTFAPMVMLLVTWSGYCLIDSLLYIKLLSSVSF